MISSGRRPLTIFELTPSLSAFRYICKLLESDDYRFCESAHDADILSVTLLDQALLAQTLRQYVGSLDQKLPYSSTRHTALKLLVDYSGEAFFPNTAQIRELCHESLRLGFGNQDRICILSQNTNVEPLNLLVNQNLAVLFNSLEDAPAIAFASCNSGPVLFSLAKRERGEWSPEKSLALSFRKSLDRDRAKAIALSNKIKTHKLATLLILSRRLGLASLTFSLNEGASKLPDAEINTIRKICDQLGATHSDADFDVALMALNPTINESSLSRGDMANGPTNFDNTANCALHVVIESEMSKDVYRVTEKSVKPFAEMLPPVYFGNPFTVDSMRQLGFDTFDDFINHDYDRIFDPVTRIDMASKECVRALSYFRDEGWNDSFFERLNSNHSNLVYMAEDWWNSQYFHHMIREFFANS